MREFLIYSICHISGDEFHLGNIQYPRQKADMIGLWVFASIFQVSDGVAAEAGHFGELSEA